MTDNKSNNPIVFFDITIGTTVNDFIYILYLYSIVNTRAIPHSELLTAQWARSHKSHQVLLKYQDFFKF